MQIRASEKQHVDPSKLFAPSLHTYAFLISIQTANLDLKLSKKSGPGKIT